MIDDEPYLYHAPNGDPQTDTDECAECHHDPCECPPEDDRLESVESLKSFDDPFTPTKDDQPNNAPTLPADEEPEPEEHDDDDQEPDGRWAFNTEAGCWIYE